MRSTFFKLIVGCLFIASIFQLTGCVGGTEDRPFVFGDGSVDPGTPNPPPTACTQDSECSSGQTCQNGTCANPPSSSCGSNSDCATNQTCQSGTCVNNPPSTGCDSNEDCSSGQTCNTSTGTCVTPPPPQCTSNDQCSSGQTCDTSTGTCVVSGACDVNVNASLTLKIDDDFNSGHFDSPPRCCEYSGEDGGASCPIASSNLDNFLQSPSENSDLYCCGTDSGENIPGSAEHFCDSENRHGGDPELAATRWAPNAGGRIRLRFAITNGGANCEVFLVRDQFPQFRLENSALDASLVIDAGKDYKTFPPNPSQDLNPAEIAGTCQATTDANGQVQVSITSLPLRFLVQLYENYTKCTQVDDLGDVCSSAPFTRRYLGDSEGSFQIIPGVNSASLTLTTGSSSVNPSNPANQSGALAVQGQPLQFNTDQNASTISLVTAFAMPPASASTIRNDGTGAGQLLAELGGAILTAELRGTATNAKGQPIRTLADLTTDCGTSSGGGGGGGGNRLELSVRSTFDGTNDDLVVSGDAANASGAFTAEACIPGTHENNSCKFFDTPALPFAKDTTAGDPATGVEAKFQKEGTLTIQNAGGSSATVALQVPETAGAFRILNASSLQNISLAPGNSTTVQIRFEPEVNASGCTTSGNTISCQAPLTISSSHNITITLRGLAKMPLGEVTLQEINPTAPNASVATVAAGSTVDFGETRLGGETRTKLYRLANTGVRPITLQDLQAQDVRRNFRLGSVYQGADFASRAWRIGANPWMIAPDGSSDFFFFLNYGPFGKITGKGANTRADAGALVLNTSAGVQNISLAGMARLDTRATLALYIEDPNRFTVTGAEDPEHREINDAGTVRHVYPASSRLFSFRQDNTPRVVYLMNDSNASNADQLVIQRLQFTADTGSKIAFTPDSGAQATACLAAAETATEACATLTGTGDTNRLKLGTMTFTPSTGAYALAEGSMVVKALSRPVGSANGSAPKITGDPTDANTDQVINFALKGASGAPGGTFDLKVHRLIAGFSNKINQGLQKTLIVSTSTKGVLTRFNAGSGPDVNINTLAENFTLEDGISLDPVTGQATLKRIVTRVDTDPNNPVSPSVRCSNSPSTCLQGLRLFNAPGSTPSQTEYFAECSAASSHNCAFFYLYIGDWAGSTTASTCNGATKFPVIPNYSGAQADRDALFAQVMKPDVEAEFSCLSGAGGFKDKIGIFDPVTGEVTFRDLAVRLYAPNIPALSNSDVDATIRLTLTTSCLNQEDVPDSNARPQYLVPTSTTNDSSFNTTLAPTNALLPYVDQTGSICGAQRQLHGRSMFTPDTTDTLDNASDPDTLNFEGFDLAGIGRNVASATSVAPANMYIVIKAEVGSF